MLTDTVRRHGMDRLLEHTRGLPGQAALRVGIATCADFWRSERDLLRRLFSVGTDEPAVVDGLRQREAWRTEQFATLVAAASPGAPPPTLGAVVALTGLAVYDQLLTHTGDHATTEQAMQRSVAACIGPEGLMTTSHDTGGRRDG